MLETPSLFDRWIRVPLTRRQFTKEAASGVLIGGAVAGGLGFAVGREAESRLREALEITDEPLEIQIKKVELRAKQERLTNKELRDHYVYLLSLWYGINHSFDTLTNPEEEFAPSLSIYKAITYIEDESDLKRVGHETAAAWTIPRDEIVVDLTNYTYQQEYSETSTGGIITPLMYLRDNLIHEMTHFITEERREARIIDFIREANPTVATIADVKVLGFRVLFDPDPSNPEVDFVPYLIDFDEAATELIANHHQATAGLATGLPSYPDIEQDTNDKSKVEKAIDALDATLKLAGIPVDVFAKLHAKSDLDGLAILLADATKTPFADNIEKIRYGFSIIQVLEAVDHNTLGQYIQSLKN